MALRRIQQNQELLAKNQLNLGDILHCLMDAPGADKQHISQIVNQRLHNVKENVDTILHGK